MLQEILRTRFGLSSFRPHQEAVCQAVGIEGSDALVVMPTGAGKSLCYQVPGLARKGTTLVISPLVALIEDQVHRLQKLSGGSVRADRIHSGRSREDSRAALGAYLRRDLDFLFIAPERLAVPGFSEILRKHPPSLIAVDEAHCISHWGHDFRPDYRLVGERLSQLSSTPMIALTATATPLVQRDICSQLRLRDARLFIHGFRRENLGVRLEECLPSLRLERMLDFLDRSDRLPAIVYAPTRGKAEEIARGISRRFSSAAYHAGMPAAERERVQLDFIHERIQVIVATVAFGMGIDKANIRTVIHAALPASVESYYQEIGRAGRDGKPSEALLLHGFSDRKTHEFFFERDYPDSKILERIHALIEAQGSLSREALQARLASLETQELEKALEKLWAHGGVAIDPDDNITFGSRTWKAPYEEQRRYRFNQLELMQAFTRAPGCRMLGLVSHFGDPADTGQPCGLCDRCVPSLNRRVLDEKERAIVTLGLSSLAGKDGQAAGKLFEEATAFEAKLSRSGFERLLDALVSARLIRVSQEEFERDGKCIAYRRLFLTSAGRQIQAAEIALLEIEGSAPVCASSAFPKAGKNPPRSKSKAQRWVDSPSSELPPLFEALRAWRRETAKKRGVPPFRVLSDRVLLALCERLPRTEDSLLQVAGIGPKIARQYGPEILQAISKASP